ncbi:MAG: stage II sporulation protein R [Clostridia bacterium]|nr:stage II sporulation protein R [Clostridia bacterium]
MKTKLIALFCACFILLTAIDTLIPRSEGRVFDNVIRLHILANDNSDIAQKIKLKVRDAILDECGDIFSDSGDIITAEANLSENMARIEEISNRVLLENGADYKATAELGNEDYPTRDYEEFSLPAGNYKSLRIKLGNASGNNWWCILFPPLCTRASSDLSSSGINEKDTEVFTRPKYKFRFKLLEFFGG